MTKYICAKHSELNAEDRVRWYEGSSKIWCRHCIEEMMNKNCADMIIIDEKKDK